MIDLYDARSRSLMFRFLMLISAAGVVGGHRIAWETSAIPASQLSDADWFAGTIGPWLLVAIFLMMWGYGLLYIRSIRFDPRRSELHVRTLGLLVGRRLRFPAADVLESSVIGSHRAPGFLIRIKGRRLPLILDRQGTYINDRLVRRYMKVY